MIQQNLPLYNPRDRGRLNALRNIIAVISDELRRQAPIVRAIVDFTTRQLPWLLRQHKPFSILSPDHINPIKVSPYPFDIYDLVQMSNRPEGHVFPTVAELAQSTDNSVIYKEL